MNAPFYLPSTVAYRLARDNFDLFVRLAFLVLEPGQELKWAWYLDAMASALTDVERGECLRLLMTIPPRYMKSLLTSVMFPAWVLGRNPSKKIICVSYGQDLATLHSRNFRRLIQSGFYHHVFPTTAVSFTRAVEHDLQTKQGGYRLATSVGGPITGFGADYLLIDDLLKPIEARSADVRQRAREYVDDTLLSRLNEKATGRLIAIQQRLHEDDIVAHLKEKGGFRELDFPAIAVRDEDIPLSNGRTHHRKIGDVLNPVRESAETLEKIRREMGNRGFEAQYQQNPGAADTAYIDRTKIQRYDAVPDRSQIQWVVQSWDTAISTASGADYSVCTTWGYNEQTWLLLDVIRERLIFNDLLARTRLARNHWKADRVLIEDAGVGKGLHGYLSQDWRTQGPRENHAPYSRPLLIPCIAGKEERMMGQVERLYNGFAKLPRQAPWLDTLLDEMRAFPDGKHDDQIDSISQFLNYAWKQDPRYFVKEGERMPSIRQPGLPLHSR